MSSAEVEELGVPALGVKCIDLGLASATYNTCDLEIAL